MTLEILTGEALSAEHGFFTRKGGVSTGIYAGLNCGLGSNDAREAVLDNRARVTQALGLETSALRTVHQIHSPDVVTFDNTTPQDPQKADAMVTATKGIALGILTADCAPILFEDVSAGVIGAAHSGWKGALGGVADATLGAMERLGANRANVKAVVGPCISQRAYEVGPEFFEDFMLQDMAYSRFFAQGTGDRVQFDLPSFCLHQLRSAGVGHAEWTGHCTYFDADRFYSYRRACHQNETDYGRLISVISL